MKYYKKISLSGAIVGMGYIDEEFANNMLFQTFREVEYSEMVEIDVEEFKELGRKYNFEGMKPSATILPGSYFSVSLN